MLDRFHAYDADVYAPCRYHLLRRTEPLNSSLDSTPQPGGKGRHLLEGDPSGIVGMSQMMLRASAMCNNILMYNLFQGIVIMSLLFHFIYYIGFQPRMAIYPGELVGDSTMQLFLSQGIVRVMIRLGGKKGSPRSKNNTNILTWHL